MKFTFKATVILTLENKEGDTNSSIDEVILVADATSPVDNKLDINEPLDRKVYLTDQGEPTMAGTKAITVALISGLVGNIEYASKLGYWDKHAHRAYILDQLIEKLDMLYK